MKKSNKILILLIVILIVLLGIVGINKQNAVDIGQVNLEYDDYATSLEKYEMVFVYPKEQKEEIEKIKDELKQIYNLAHDKLIVTYMEYDKSDCKNTILADIELQGDISYRRIVFVYTNSDMCESIQFSLQNTTSSVSKHKEGFARQKVITIPIDEKAKKSMEEWNKERQDWYNYKNTTNTSGAIAEMYKTLDITKEEVEEANKEESNKGTTNSKETKNKEEKTLEVDNGDIKIDNKVQMVQIVLSNGMIVNPDNIGTNDVLKTISLNSSTMHGARVYIQYKISVEKTTENEDINIEDINITCKNDKLKFEKETVLLDENAKNESQGWNVSEDGPVTNTIQVGESKKLVGYQVITNGMELVYENQITDIKYTKKTITTKTDGTKEENTEEVVMNNIIKSDVIKIEEE